MGGRHPSFDQGYRATSSTILIDKKQAKTRAIVMLELRPTAAAELGRRLSRGSMPSAHIICACARASDESGIACFIINETVYKPTSPHLFPIRCPHKTHPLPKSSTTLESSYASAAISLPIRIQRPESAHRSRSQKVDPVSQSLGPESGRTEVSGAAEERFKHHGICYQFL
jgi:hypothetical protein